MSLTEEMARKILADEVLIVSPGDTEMARAIRDGTAEEANNFVKISLAAMRFTYDFGFKRGTHSTPD